MVIRTQMMFLARHKYHGLACCSPSFLALIHVLAAARAFVLIVSLLFTLALVLDSAFAVLPVNC